MLTLLSHLFAFFLGGVTLLPLLIILLLGHAYLTLPVHELQDDITDGKHDLDLSEQEKDAADQELKALPQDLKLRAHEPDVAAGYFAVCREYDGTLMNGKPLDKTAPTAPSSTGPESSSVYQTMYRSIFERGKTQGPTINGSAKGSKRTRNVFFIVIRYVFCGHGDHCVLI
jgi:hypothetical protein